MADCLIAGLGNPYCGDDAIGLLVARKVHEILRSSLDADFIELTASPFDVAERIAGRRGVILIDALIDDECPVGTVRRIDAAECQGQTSLGMHTAGLAGALALARVAGLAVPEDVVLYGIVIRQPREFSEQLSRELSAKLPEIVRAIADGLTPLPGCN